MDSEPTYVVQVYTSFAPPHLIPLLVRVPEGATVEETVEASLTKLIAQDPMTSLPSDMLDEYSVRAATGNGQPQYQSIPYAGGQVLRAASGMEFPFMIFLSYSGRGNSQDQQQAAGDEMSPLRGSRHPLSGSEKAALEAQRQQVEARRQENIRRIEKRRMEDQINAFNRCETYEMKRRAEEAKAKERDAKLELSREADRAAHEAATAARDTHRSEAENQAASKTFDQTKETLRLRGSMKNALMSEARRQQDLTQALELKQNEDRKEQERRAADRRRQADAEKGDRMYTDMEQLLGNLEAKCGLAKEEQDSVLAEQRHQRQMFQSAAADTKAITLLEYQRNGRKLLSRDERKSHDSEAEQHQLLLELQEAERLATLRAQESMHHANWKAQHERDQKELAERFEDSLKGITPL